MMVSVKYLMNIKVIYEKAHALAHFTYNYTGKEMMLLDLQGSGYSLYDPEIATSDLFDDDGEAYFCAGNMATDAIDKFFKQHICNKFCEMLNLDV